MAVEWLRLFFFFSGLYFKEKRETKGGGGTRGQIQEAYVASGMAAAPRTNVIIL